jgi:hypothetical protein
MIKNYTKQQIIIAKDLARRYVEFHDGQDWKTIKLWGLADWGQISKLLKNDDVVTDMTKDNKTLWYYPSESFYNNLVKYFIEEYRNDNRCNKNVIWFLES